jgi:hypothetical protein
MKVWSGTTWAEKPTKVWNGSAWVAKPVKVWTGSAWVVKPPVVSGPAASLCTSFTPGAPATDRDDFTGEVGVRVNMVANRLVSFLGMRCNTGNSGIHKLNLYEWFADALVATANIDLTGKAAGSWVWAPITPFTLLVGYYALLKEVVAGSGQMWVNNAPTTFNPTYTGNIYATYRSPGGAMGVTGNDLQFVGVDLGW